MSRLKFKSSSVPVFCFKFPTKLRKDNSLVAQGVDMSGIKLQGFIEFLKSGFLPPHEISKNSGKKISLYLLLPFSQEGTGFQEHVFFPEHPF